VGFVVTIRLFAGLFWDSLQILDLVGVSAVLALLPFMIYSKRVYDLSALFLFTLGLLLLAKGRWGWFLLVYLLGCLNKETTLFLTLVFAACFWGHRRERRFWQLLTAPVAWSNITCSTTSSPWR
jgi:hypothetical protein